MSSSHILLWKQLQLFLGIYGNWFLDPKSKATSISYINPKGLRI